MDLVPRHTQGSHRATRQPRNEQPIDGQAGDKHASEGVADLLPATYDSAADSAAVGELAEAERAAARHTATPDQARGVRAAGQARRDKDRLARWQQHHHDPAHDDTDNRQHVDHHD